MKTLSPSLEDYLEAIYLLKEKKGFTRVSEIADFLNVKMSSVNSALKTLLEKGLVIHETYGYVNLTDKGEENAKKVYSRHTILKRFFKEILELDEETAEKDACKIEHHISEKSLGKLLKYIKKVIKRDASISD